MHALILLEISRKQDGSLPDRLLELAYRASQRGRVILLLDGISPFEVDAALDPLVHQLPLDIPGVVYHDHLDDIDLSEVVEHTPLVFLSSRAVRRHPSLHRAAQRSCATPGAAAPILERLGRPTSLRELTDRSQLSGNHRFL